MKIVVFILVANCALILLLLFSVLVVDASHKIKENNEKERRIKELENQLHEDDNKKAQIINFSEALEEYERKKREIDEREIALKREIIRQKKILDEKFSKK